MTARAIKDGRVRLADLNDYISGSIPIKNGQTFEITSETIASIPPYLNVEYTAPDGDITYGGHGLVTVPCGTF